MICVLIQASAHYTKVALLLPTVGLSVLGAYVMKFLPTK